MTSVGEALAVGTELGLGDVEIQDFTIFGYKAFTEGRAAEIHNLITAADITRTIDGAPTLSVDLLDPHRILSEMNFLSYRITMVLDTLAFELAQVKKSGDSFKLVFEDVRVAEMRRMDKPRKVAARTMSRVEFGYLLLSELPKVDFVTPAIELQVTSEEMARGKVPDPTDVSSGTPATRAKADENLEDTWKALTRIFGEVRWRFWVDMGRVFAAPDTYLIELPSAATLRERTGGVDDIDYDIDEGKLVNKVTLNVIANRWALPIGSRVDIDDPGPVHGAWLVSEIRRSLFSKMAVVTLVNTRAPLQEPPSQPTSGDPQAATTVPAATGPKRGLSQVGAGGASGSAESAVQFALSKEGGPYVWGGTGPTGYDCSGLVQAAFREAGVQLPRVSHDQYDFCANGGGAVSVADAANIRGAILEHPPHTTGPSDSGHIAISLGNGNGTIEAMGRAYGIVQGHIHGRPFSRAARVPGVAY